LTTESSVSAYLVRDWVNDMVHICDLSRVNSAPRQPRCGTLSGYMPRLSPAAPPVGLTMDAGESGAVELGVVEDPGAVPDRIGVSAH